AGPGRAPRSRRAGARGAGRRPARPAHRQQQRRGMRAAVDRGACKGAGCLRPASGRPPLIPGGWGRARVRRVPAPLSISEADRLQSGHRRRSREGRARPVETAPTADRRRLRPSAPLPSSPAISHSLVPILVCLALAAAASTLPAFHVQRLASLPAPAPVLAAAAILL